MEDTFSAWIPPRQRLAESLDVPVKRANELSPVRTQLLSIVFQSLSSIFPTYVAFSSSACVLCALAKLCSLLPVLTLPSQWRRCLHHIPSSPISPNSTSFSVPGTMGLLHKNFLQTLSQSTWETCKQQTLIAHSAGGCKVQGQGASTFG